MFPERFLEEKLQEDIGLGWYLDRTSRGKVKAHSTHKIPEPLVYLHCVKLLL